MMRPDTRGLVGLAALAFASLPPLAFGEPGAERRLADSVTFGDVGIGELHPLFPSPGEGAPVPRVRRVRGQIVGVNDRIWIRRKKAWRDRPAPARLWDLIEAFGELWAVDDEGQLWRAAELAGPWTRGATLERPVHPERWRETERVAPPSREASALVFTGKALLAVALDGTTWESLDGTTWKVHPQELRLPWARPFHLAGETYLDGNLLHVWTGEAWVPVGHRGNDDYARDDERVYVVSWGEPSERSTVRQAFRGLRRLLFTTDLQEVSDGSKVLVSGRKVGPWFPQSDGSALVHRGDDATMSTAAQWLRVTPSGDTTALLEHGRPEEDPFAWPMHASHSGVVVAGASTGTLAWDRHDDAPPTRFPLAGIEAVAVTGGAYLQVEDRIHWLDLATGTAEEVYRIREPDTLLEAAAPGHLWLLDWEDDRLSHVDLGAGTMDEVASGVRGTELWRGSTHLGWLREERSGETTAHSQWTVPLVGGAVTRIGAAPTYDLVERGKDVVRVTPVAGVMRKALWADGVIGHVYGRVSPGEYALFGDWLVRTDTGIVGYPVQWGDTPRPWP